ncbi:MAG: hypothetical protein ACK4IY_00525, partial [Chitinophagales bacterium]
EAAYRFITLESFESSKVSAMEYRLTSLKELNLTDLLEKQTLTAEKLNETSELRYFQKLRDKIWLVDFKLSVAIRKNRTKLEMAAKTILQINPYQSLLDFAMAKSYNHLLNRHRAFYQVKHAFDYQEANKLFAIYESGVCSDSKFVRAMYLLAQFVVLEKTEVYPELKSIVFNKKLITSAADQENILIGMLGHITKQIEKENDSWRIEMFDIYDYRLKNNLWSIHGELAYTTLINIVHNAIFLKKEEYAEETVIKLAAFIPAHIRNDVTNLCMAIIHFHKKNIDESHALLVSIQTENIVIKYELRTLQAMIFFARQDYITLLSHLESFKHFIIYNKSLVEEVFMQAAAKFCNYLMQLCKLRLDPNKKNVEKLRKTIEADRFFLKQWLLENIEQTP